MHLRHFSRLARKLHAHALTEFGLETSRPPRLPVPAHFLLTSASVNYCDIFVQYYTAKKNIHNCTYSMSLNILNVPTGTNFAGFFYTNKSMLH
jgi:hypothetical protein